MPKPILRRKRAARYGHTRRRCLPVEDFVELTKWDPYDVQILFILFCRLRTTNKKPDLPTFQFARRAAEMAPGYGKAQMVVNSSRSEEANLVLHAKLAVHLLSSNVFAYSNYFAYLYRRKQSPEDMSMVERAISLDPENIQPYFQGITFYKWAGRFQEALNLALRLKQVATPPLSQRTIYCIRQNHVRGKNYDEGKYNPLADAEEEIALLQSKL